MNQPIEMSILFHACIILLLVTIVLSAPCSHHEYHEDGSSCTANDECRAFLNCRVNSTKTCEYANAGAKCSASADCYQYQEQGIECVKGKCSKLNYNGYTCASDGDCFGKFCNTTSTLCDGLPIGTACDPTSRVSCAAGLYCTTTSRTCVPQIPNGGPCNDYTPVVPVDAIPIGSNYFIMCVQGKCMGTVGRQTCIKYRYSEYGSTCVEDEECIFGLYCDGTQKKCLRKPPASKPCGSMNCTGFDSECICTPAGDASCQNVNGLDNCVSHYDSPYIYDEFRNVFPSRSHFLEIHALPFG
jgi:hypothetical protein